MIEVEVESLTLIFAPTQINVTHMIKLYGLKDFYLSRAEKPSEKKKIEKMINGLDRIFYRAIYPPTKKRMIYITGSSVYGAFRTEFENKGIDMPKIPKIYGIYFPEDAVSIHIMPINRKEEASLLIAEVVLPNNKGYLLMEDKPPASVMDMTETIQLGAMKKRGYGLIEIKWDTLKFVEKQDILLKKKRVGR